MKRRGGARWRRTVDALKNEVEVRLQMHSIRSLDHVERIVLTNQYRLLRLALEVEGGARYGLRIEKSLILNTPGRRYHSMLHLQL